VVQNHGALLKKMNGKKPLNGRAQFGCELLNIYVLPYVMRLAIIHVYLNLNVNSLHTFKSKLAKEKTPAKIVEKKYM
jgi:hypothetical protein